MRPKISGGLEWLCSKGQEGKKVPVLLINCNQGKGKFEIDANMFKNLGNYSLYFSGKTVEIDYLVGQIVFSRNSTEMIANNT